MIPTLDLIELPEKTTVWENEDDFTPIGQSVELDVNGTPVIEYVSPPSGYWPVRLACGWIKKSVLDQLRILRDASVQELLPLELPDGRTFDVIWDHKSGSPIEAVPVIERPEYGDDDDFEVFLNLIRIL